MSRWWKGKDNRLKLFVFSFVIILQLAAFQLVATALYMGPLDIVRAIFSQLAFSLLTASLLILPQIWAILGVGFIVMIGFMQFISLSYHSQNLSDKSDFNPVSDVLTQYFYLHESWSLIFFYLTIIAVGFFVVDKTKKYFYPCHTYRREIAIIAFITLVTDLLLPSDPLGHPDKNLNLLTYTLKKSFISKKEKISEAETFVATKPKKSLVVINAQGLGHDQTFFNLMEKLNKRNKAEEVWSSSIIVSRANRDWGLLSLCSTQEVCLFEQYRQQGTATYFLAPYQLSESLEEKVTTMGFSHIVVSEFSQEQLVSSKPSMLSRFSLFETALGVLKSSHKSLVYVDLISLVAPYIALEKTTSQAIAHARIDKLLDSFLTSIKKEGIDTDVVIYSTNPNPLVAKRNPMSDRSGLLQYISRDKKFSLEDKRREIKEDELPKVIDSLFHKENYSIKGQNIFIQDRRKLRTILMDKDFIHFCDTFWNWCRRLKR